jgi:hypothetical protein
MLLKNLFEEIARTGQGSTAVVGWGRGMGHKGHMMLASSVITKSKEVGGDPYFVVSRTVGKDDPITPEEKLAIYKKVFPQQGHIFQAASDEIPDLTRVLTDLKKQGYKRNTSNDDFKIAKLIGNKRFLTVDDVVKKLDEFKTEKLPKGFYKVGDLDPNMSNSSISPQLFKTDIKPSFTERIDCFLSRFGTAQRECHSALTHSACTLNTISLHEMKFQMR